MKVAQEIDVDNVTIIINPQNKLEAKIPTSTQSEVVIEEVPNVTPANVVVTLNGTERRITKLGKVNGTEWLVFQLDKPKPHIPKTISVEFYDDVGTSSDGGMTFNHTGKIRVTTEDGSPFTTNGSSAYNAVSDIDLRAVLKGNTQEEPNIYPVINFNTMTYSLEVTYQETQTSSTFESVGTLGIYFSAEHEDAIYDYSIDSVSRGADTPSQPPTSDTEWYATLLCEQNESNPIYDETYTGVTLSGSLPANITEVVLTQHNGAEIRLPYSSTTTQYKFNVNPKVYTSSGEYVTKVTLVTAQGDVSKNVSESCTFIYLPE